MITRWAASANSRHIGIAMVVISALLFSFNGLILRQMTEASALQATFYRSASMSVALLLVFLLIYRGHTGARISAIGLRGVVAGGFLGLATITIFIAMNHTTVANTVFINSAVPFFSTALAWLFLGEKIPRLMLICMATAFAGVAVMVTGSIGVNEIFGSLMAVTSALVFAIFVVILRSRQQINMTPVVAVSGLITCVFILAMTGGDLSVPLRDLVLALIWGAAIAALGHSLFVLAAARLVAGEVTFVMLLENVLAPTWVWLVLREVPALATFTGGAIVMGALGLWIGRGLNGVAEK